MPYQELKDLELAGVKWELAEIPLTTKTPQQNKSVPEQKTNNGLNEILKTQASLVPPIAPVQTISIETVRAMASRPTDTNALLRMILLNFIFICFHLQPQQQHRMISAMIMIQQ